MSTTTSAPTLHEEFATGLANRAARLGVTTDRAGFAERADYYKELVADAARLFMYGERAYWTLMEQVIANGKVFPKSRMEDRVAVVAREAWAVIEKGVTGKRVEGFALNVTREIAMMDGNSKYNRPKHAAGIAVSAVAGQATTTMKRHRDDVQVHVALSAAIGITAQYTKGISAPLSAETAYLDLNDTMSLAAVVEYLIELVPALKTAERGDLHLNSGILSQEAQEALRPLRDERGGISQEVQRASRRIAAHRSAVAGLEGEDLAAEEARFAADVAKRPAVFAEAEAVLDTRSGFVLDESFDNPFEDEVEGIWGEMFPVFEPLGVYDADELQVLISEMLGEKVAHVPGKKDCTLSPIALRTQKPKNEDGSPKYETPEEAKERKAEAKRLRETLARIRENLADVEPALRAVLAA